jgi:hypothetical protein
MTARLEVGMWWVLSGCLFLTMGAPVAAQGTGAPRDGAAFLALGIRQAEEGDFETAAFSLDTAVRKLAEAGASKGELARAYLHLGAAYVGLGHDENAKAKFRQALGHDPTVRPDPEKLSARTVKLFEEEVNRSRATRQGHKAKFFLMAGGAAAATAVGVAVATNRTPPPANRPPTVSLAVTPAGVALMSVTTLEFAATGADADLDPLSYAWDFGDGGTATGSQPRHVYDREGRFEVRVTVSDGRGLSAATSTTVTVASLSGTWRNRFTNGTADFRLTQAGITLRADCVSSTITGGCGNGYGFDATLSAPRQMSLLTFGINTGGVDRRNPCTGQVDSTLTTIQTGCGGFDLLTRQ